MDVNTNFDVVTWPPQSLDLNLIENVWALVKHKSNEYSTPTIMLKLWEHVQVSFHYIILSNVESSIITCPIISKLF